MLRGLKLVGLLMISFVAWPLFGGFFGDHLHCACHYRFFFPGYEAYRSSFGDPFQSVCLRYLKKSAVPKYHYLYFPWFKPNWNNQIRNGPDRLISTSCVNRILKHFPCHNVFAVFLK
jgi:hypothetical protein